eukprot:444727_1
MFPKIISFSCLLATIYCECKWGNVNLLPIGALDHPIQCSYFSSISQSDRIFEYLPCENGQLCEPNGNDEYYMVIQRNEGNNNNCRQGRSFKWSGSIKPIFNEDSFTFKYIAEGNNDCPLPLNMQMTITYICDETLDGMPYNVDRVTCGDRIDNNGDCIYYIDIPSYYGCVSAPNENNNISVGSVFIIIFTAITTLYCLIGYIVNTMRSEARDWSEFKEHVPNSSFWINFYENTKAGCMVSYQCIISSISAVRNNNLTNDTS